MTGENEDACRASASAMSTIQVFRTAGVGLLTSLCALNFFDDFGLIAFGVLSPDIQSTLGLSDTGVTVIGTLGGALILLGSVPAAVIADRADRTRVIALTSVLLGGFTLLTGAAQAVWHLVIARLGAGVSKGNLPAFNSLIADAAPIEGRARAFALFNGSNSAAAVLTPVTVGAVASVAGGTEGWRWAFALSALPLLALGAASLLLRDPGRGRFERAAVFGDDALAEEGPPPKMDEGFARLRRIRTFYYLILAFSVVGVGLFVVPTLQNLYLEDEFGLDAVGRGVVGSVIAIGSLVGSVLAGVFGDRIYQRGPAEVLRLVSWVLLGMASTAVAFQMPSPATYALFALLGGVPLGMVFVLLSFATAPIIPPRLRSMGFALAVLYMAVAGGLGGSILGGSLSDSFGPSTAVTIVLGLSIPAATLLLRHATQFVEGDIAAVEQDLRDEEEQRQRRLLRPDGPLPREPLLEVRRLDFSYGSLQVLFDVEVDVLEGEVLALLGTNGAGKSTLLRAVTGLGFPDRGVVRFAGDDVTYAEPAQRVRRGIVQVPGGKAIFPTLTVEENLRLGGFTLNEELYQERRRQSLDLFPALQPRLDQAAGTMSGGERQMLALAKGMLLEPRLLCIDELSLGLAPIVVEQLIEVVAGLKAQGVTMLIVEQSVNVALALADRAIFMEKGHVRFQGPAAELLERGDLVRAVFLGGEGG